VDDKEVGNYWEKNAEEWTKLSRLGYDVYRNHVNTPSFLDMLPEVKNLNGLDVGCGEGYNTRLIAKKGAKMTAIDISKTFIKYAKEKERETPLGITYKVASATNLPFEDQSFDFVLSTMTFMDMSNIQKAFSEVSRVLKKGGLFQFSILHPCFSTYLRKWIKDEDGNLLGLMVGDYFNETEGDLEEWIFSAAPSDLTKDMRKFKVPRFHRTLSSWLNMLINNGFILKEFREPYANDDLVQKYPNLRDTQIVGYFLIIKCKKS
jgi:ubiquinone/menaquinone biosynthesis C-methylase UbiE